MYKGFFPDSLPQEIGKFDAITAIAVFEHIPYEQQVAFISACRESLSNNGQVILTMPSPIVDHIVNIMCRLKLVDGADMDAEGHHGLPVKSVPELFERNGFTLIRHTRFQLGLNNLFVFKK